MASSALRATNQSISCGKRMKFIIGGRTIEINSLLPGLDQSFISLHSAYFAQGTINWADFESNAMAFFDAVPGPSLASNDAYFNNFTVIWKAFLTAANFDEAEHIWSLALDPVIKWEVSNPGKRIHKGAA